MADLTAEQAEALGLRYLNATGCAWRPGMLDTGGTRWGDMPDPIAGREVISGPGSRIYVPDFRDPATLGVLLAQVREAYGAVRVSVSDEGGMVSGMLPDGSALDFGGVGTHLGVALIAALEAHDG